jgi:hypothetical protein
MKVQIRDKAVFDRLNPSDVAGYLRAANWDEIEAKPGAYSTWAKPYGKETAKILLPIDRGYLDFALRMADLVALLASVENRSQLAVVDDIQTAGMDVFRIQLDVGDSANGTISAERGSAVYDNIPELFSAAACAAQGPRIYYATRKAQAVQDFIKQLRLGQTEFGSYVVRVLSPVPPPLHDLFGAAGEPFERKAAETLLRGLAALRSASDAALATGDGKAFESAVTSGVSANLCAAVARIAGEESQIKDQLIVRMTPAKTRPMPVEIPQIITFPGDRIPIIREAARILKDIAPQEEQRIKGYVIKLQTTDEKALPAGPVTISTVIEGRQRKVTIVLPQEEHAKAIQAYRDGAEIACRGTLKKTGQHWSLQDPGKITILSES